MTDDNCDYVENENSFHHHDKGIVHLNTFSLKMLGDKLPLNFSIDDIMIICQNLLIKDVQRQNTKTIIRLNGARRTKLVEAAFCNLCNDH